MRLGRLFCCLVLIGISAVAAYAQTPINPSSLGGDPTIVFKKDPPGCTPPTCYNLDYTAAGTIVFFNVIPNQPVPPEYNCIATGGLVCSVDVTVGPPEELIAVAIFGTADQTFSLTITGGPINLVIPTSGITCLDDECAAGEPIPLDPTPEPGTALLYMTGLVLLGFGVSKRWKASSALRPY